MTPEIGDKVDFGRRRQVYTGTVVAILDRNMLLVKYRRYMQHLKDHIEDPIRLSRREILRVHPRPVVLPATGIVQGVAAPDTLPIVQKEEGHDA